MFQSSLALGTAVLACAFLFVSHSAQASPKDGAKLFKSLCVTCHGPTGAGDGPAAKAIKPKPRKLNDRKIMSKVSDKRIFSVIKSGGAKLKLSPLMPPFAHLKTGQIDDLVSHIRQLCKCEGPKKPAKSAKR
jgi:mono/diheme cytochrome c family protein